MSAEEVSVAGATAPQIPDLGDDHRLARMRLQFLTSGTLETSDVRDAILASWWRSKEFQVPADRIDLPYIGEQNLDTPLIRGAEPVMERLGDQLEGQPISLILTDPCGVVLTQRTGDRDLQRHLERVELLPGFSYGERYVGTNGIGTTLENGVPTHVFGHEHYAEHLEVLACAAMPIHHPVSGKLIGAVDLTCWRKDAGKLLIALARTTGEQIRQALLNYANLRELTLLNAYLKACRRSTGIVIAFNDDVVMMNDPANQLLAPADQSKLLEHARNSVRDAHCDAGIISLPGGSRARMRCRPVTGPRGQAVGGVLSVQLVEADEDAMMIRPLLPQFVPGLVGSAPHWLRCCREVDIGYSSGEWLAVAGEPGTGKCAVVTRVHQRRNPTQGLHTLDATRAEDGDWLGRVRQELAEDQRRALVIRHVERLDATTARALAAVLHEHRHAGGESRAPWIAVTMSTEAEGDPDLAELLALFPRTVEIPPLRHHIEDLRELVPLFLSRLGHGSGLTCSRAAMHLLMRAGWPGNIAELYEVLKHVVQRRRAGEIQPADLPAEFRSAARRSLNRLESMERDAIVQALQDAGGNKAKAATLLGISRATIYRRIHDYGIVLPQH